MTLTHTAAVAVAGNQSNRGAIGTAVTCRGTGPFGHVTPRSPPSVLLLLVDESQNYSSLIILYSVDATAGDIKANREPNFPLDLESKTYFI